MKNTYIDWMWKNKKVKLTWHAIKEVEESGKSAEAILDVLEQGIHAPESKEKTIAKLKGKRKTYEVVYAEYDDYVRIIHVRL